MRPMQKDQSRMSTVRKGETTRKRSALGVGVTTMVTILVVLLLVVFSVLTLVSARSDVRLSEKALEQNQDYYRADGEATRWYADLDAAAALLEGESGTYAEQLIQAGYTLELTTEGELRVMQAFSINDSRQLVVTVAIHEDKSTSIRQWQS